MRQFGFLLLIFLSGSARAQEYFVVRAVKDSADGFMTFYDVEEKEIPVMFSFSPQIKPSEYKLAFAIQNKNIANRTLDIYGGIIPFEKLNFDYSVPINDTFINSGNYQLTLRLFNSNMLVEEQSIDFQTLRAPNNYYNPNPTKSRNLISNKVTHSISNIDVSKTFTSRYDLSTIKKNVLALRPIAEQAEKGALETITQDDNLENLQRFFYNFWYSRNPQNPEAEWKAYADKLNYVSRKYGYGTLKGYQTDRGLLFLKFGPPNREIRASSERGTKPYEVWFYNELDKFTNLNILFVQQGSLTNERVLTHSSDPNFFFNPSWAQQLFTDPAEQLNKNSHRVYEFFK